MNNEELDGIMAKILYSSFFIYGSYLPYRLYGCRKNDVG